MEPVMPFSATVSRRALVFIGLALASLMQPVGRAAADEPGWVEIFDGKTLAGWTQRNGTATYAVVDGTIVGTTADGSPNSFLCSDKDYGDFELVLETKVDDQLNAGVQIRSKTDGGPNGRVNGPQVEVAAAGSNGSVAGYVYGEAAGGWMTPDAARVPHKHFKNGEWNAYRVLATGPRIQTWINGEKVGDLVHEERYKTHPKGFIGLQVHGIGKGSGPFQVAYRGIKAREVSAEEAAKVAAESPAASSPTAANGFIDLYNGKDLTGWETTGNWLPQADGSLLLWQRPGETGYSRFGDYLWTTQKYKDFILELEYTYPPGGNSGLYFRVPDRKNPVATGIEIQILDCSKKSADQPMIDHDHGGVLGHAPASKNMSKAPGEWNRMILTARGPHLQVELNGEKIIDTKIDEGRLKTRPPEGYIGLQDHGEPHSLRFRNIRIKPL
jgi:hypothetical protein